MGGPLEFVFSFRSPFAWIAAKRVVPRVDPAIEVRWRAFYPLPSFPNFQYTVPAKQRYKLRDLLRLVEYYGLELGRPAWEDPDWSVPHAAFAKADELGLGPAMGIALYDARWTRGLDIAQTDVIEDVARSVGAEPAEIVSACTDDAYRAALTLEVEANYQDRGWFGVPMFVKPDGERFWGHERMEWAIDRGMIPGNAGHRP